MITKITSAIILISFTASAQQGKMDCKKALGKVPYFIRHKTPDPADSLQKDFDILKSCGSLDSIDYAMLNGPTLGFLTIKYSPGDKVVTYNTILKSITAYKKTADYTNFREAITASRALENKIATVEGFEKDRELLLKAGMPQAELDSFKVFIQSNASQKMTYKEAYAKYSSAKQSSQPAPPAKIEFSELVDLESAIKIGKANGKRVLLYFSCHACVNARKTEDRILTNDQVKLLLAEKFSYFVAYTDDNSKDKTSNSKVGKKFIKLQSELAKTSYQPYFCIIDNNGKVLSEIGYTSNVQEFIDFLNKGWSELLAGIHWAT